MRWGSSISSDTIAASWPPHSFASTSTSLATTSSFFCASPCTFWVPTTSPMPASAPFPTAWLIILHARAITSSRSLQLGRDLAGAALLLDEVLR